MVGQQNNINTIMKWRMNKSIPRFIIIEGATGSGRLTLAKVILKIINATGIISGNSISDIREIIENAYTISSTTCYIFRDCDDMSVAATNSLLKIVEEPPQKAYFIMTIKDINNMLDTIKSRGALLRIEPYSRAELRNLCNDELLLEYCSTPGQLQIDRQTVEQAENCVDEIIKALIDKSGTKLLKATTQLQSKQLDTDKVDCDLFYRIFKKRLFNAVNSNLLIINLPILTECGKELNKNSVNKKSSIECMLIRILEQLKAGGKNG